MKISAALFTAALLTGCQTPHQFAAPDKTWKTHIGQLKYSDATRTLIGDVVVQQRGVDDFQLDFQKAGGIPLLTLREDATTARAEGLFARGSWQGAPAAAPNHLWNWVALRTAFHFPATTTSQHALKAIGIIVSGDGRQSVSIGFPTDDQHFVFQFNR